MDIKGKVHEISPVINVTDTFKKRELIVEYAENPSFPEYIKFEALQDKVNLFDAVKVGEEIEVFFNLRGRPWTDRNGKTSYFNSLVAWRVNVLSGADAAGSSPEIAPHQSFDEPGAEDDLPF